jgi:hypothetical protein
METFLQSVIKGLGESTGWAVVVGLVGAFWQGIYIYSRDRSRDRQTQRESELQEKRFEQQSKLEKLRFEHELRRWREELATQLTLKNVDVRLAEYAQVWAHVSAVASHRMGDGEVTPELTQKLARQVHDWRYAKGGLLADEPTRHAAMEFQRALWAFDGRDESYQLIRSMRRHFRDALRADMGLGENALGDKIIDVAERIQKTRPITGT